MKKVFEGDTDLLIRKGVYPYDYMDNFDKFNGNEFPPVNEFYSRLYDSGKIMNTHKRFGLTLT